MKNLLLLLIIAFFSNITFCQELVGDFEMARKGSTYSIWKTKIDGSFGETFLIDGFSGCNSDETKLMLDPLKRLSLATVVEMMKSDYENYLNGEAIESKEIKPLVSTEIIISWKHEGGYYFDKTVNVGFKLAEIDGVRCFLIENSDVLISESDAGITCKHSFLAFNSIEQVDNFLKLLKTK